MNKFIFNDKEYIYCDSKYNDSRLNERCIEVAIALPILEKYKANCLEVGAVLPHYSDIQHTVVDLKERGDMITNENILAYHAPLRFKAAISISTLEHVGNGHGDSLYAIEHILSLLENDAPYLFTIPYGYSKILDKAILEGHASVDKIYQMNKVDFKNHYWQQVEFKESDLLAYNGLSKWCNSVFILTNL